MTVSRMIRMPLIAAAALGGVLVAAGPASARFQEPGLAGSISGGMFGGVRLGPSESANTTDVETTGSNEVGSNHGVVGENCYLLKEQVANDRGGVATRRVRVCE